MWTFLTVTLPGARYGLISAFLVAFLSSPSTTLASVAVLDTDDAAEIVPAAAMGMMIFYTNAGVRIADNVFTHYVLGRTQAWRKR